VTDGPGGPVGHAVPVGGRLGMLELFRRRWGLALLCAAAVLAAVGDLYFASSTSNGPEGDWQAGMYLYAAAWAVVAVAAFCGAAWAGPATGTPRGDRVVLAVGGGAAALVGVVNVASTLADVGSWSDGAYDTVQVLHAVADLTIGALILIVAARHGSHPVPPRGHVPLGPLLMAGTCYLGTVYGELYGTTWFADSPTNSAVASILAGIAFGGIGVALLIAAALRLGPAYRLLVAGSALIVIGVTEGVFLGVYLRPSVSTVLSVVEAAAFAVIAGVLLGSALLAPSRRAASSRWPEAPQWPGPFGAPGIPVAYPVPVAAPPVPPAWPPAAWPQPGVPPAPPPPGP
jgi:hypothetical protein